MSIMLGGQRWSSHFWSASHAASCWNQQRLAFLFDVASSVNIRRVIFVLCVGLGDGHEGTGLRLRLLERDALAEVFEAVLLIGVLNALLLIRSL